MTNAAVRVGAVAAGPSRTTIWEGMRAYFAEAGVPIVPVLFSSYEEQTETRSSTGPSTSPGMGRWRMSAAPRARPTAGCWRCATWDVDFTTVLVARRDSGIGGLDDLRGK